MNCYVMSDIHGSYIPIDNFYRRNKNILTENDCLILLGDSGFLYFQDRRDRNFKKKVNKYPFKIFTIRGNHEMRPSVCANINPDRWEEDEYFDGPVWIEKEYPNIIYAMDYPCLYHIPHDFKIEQYDPPKKTENGDKVLAEMFVSYYKTLVIPGAYSVDKYYRLTQGWNWFEDEQLTSEEMDLGREIIKQNPAFDLVLSHTCPITYEPTDLFLPQVDQSLVDKTMERYLGEIEYKINYKLWLWGHFHDYRVYPRYQNSQCIMLSAGQEAINIQEWLEKPEEIHTKY